MFQTKKLCMGRPKAKTNWQLSLTCKKLGMAVERGMAVHKQERRGKKVGLCRAIRDPIRVWDLGIQTNESHEKIQI